MLRYLLAILFVSTALSCKKKVRHYFDNGVLEMVYSVNKAGNKDGDFKRYFKNGSLAETSHFKDGAQDGTRKLYYENGNIEEVQLFKNGKLDGEQKGYHENGKLKFSCTNLENLLQGEYHSYYDNGKKRLFLTFVDDLENGPFIEYYRTGGIEWKGSYRNGNKEFGLLEQYDEKGELIKKMDCDTMGVCYTIWKKEN